MSKFPDFVIVGSMKCGTTVLWYNLDKHPDVNMCKNPEDPKKKSTEIRFWNDGEPYHPWKKGVDWYKGLFLGDCCGEKCANYIESKIAFERMEQHIPNTKLILCARNPVDRAYSEYQMSSVLRSYRHIPFKKKFRDDSFFRWKGDYYDQISKNILPFFPKEQLYVVIQERMKNNPEIEMNKLYEFLGVSEFSNATDDIVAKDKDDVVGGYKRWTSHYDPMSDALRAKIKSYYQTPMQNFFDFFGERIEEWHD